MTDGDPSLPAAVQSQTLAMSFNGSCMHSPHLQGTTHLEWQPRQYVCFCTLLFVLFPCLCPGRAFACPHLTRPPPISILWLTPNSLHLLPTGSNRSKRSKPDEGDLTGLELPAHLRARAIPLPANPVRRRFKAVWDALLLSSV